MELAVVISPERYQAAVTHAAQMDSLFNQFVAGPAENTVKIDSPRAFNTKVGEAVTNYTPDEISVQLSAVVKIVGAAQAQGGEKPELRGFAQAIVQHPDVRYLVPAFADTHVLFPKIEHLIAFIGEDGKLY